MHASFFDRDLPLHLDASSGLLSLCLVMVPSFPEAGPVRVIAITGTASILAFAAAALVLARAGSRQEMRWAITVCLLALVTTIIGRLAPGLHPFATAATLGTGFRNAVYFRGLARWLQITGLACWVIAILAARTLFG